MTSVFGLFVLSMLLVTAIGIVRAKDLFVAVMLSGIFSLQMASMFFILDAADVALTEAAVGAGVSTVFLLGALALLDRHERARAPRRLAVVLAAAIAAALIYSSFEQPRLGDPEAPVQQHVAPWYLSETPELIAVPNVVAAILASFRGYDTLGELFVIFTAGIGVLFILSVPSAASASSAVERESTRVALRHHLIPRVVGRLLVPFIVLFGLYVQFHGDYGPGGGFQAGALVAAALILHALLEGETAALRAVRTRVLLTLMALGGLLYAGTGLAAIALGGNFLDYSVLRPDPIAGQHLGILLIEFGVGLNVAAVMLVIFHAFAARERSR